MLSIKRGSRDITRSDTVVALLSLLAMSLWLVADQPVAAIILAVIADLLAFVPTVRKSWIKPYSETLSLYTTNTARFILAFLAIENYTILSYLWPLAWVFMNGLFSLMLVIRRKQVS